MLYPLFKRFTHWPQAWLGLAMNSGLITAWIATTGFLDFGVLSAGMFGCWW
jgi:4-hydroxybenzoate polyprenyltransferase